MLELFLFLLGTCFGILLEYALCKTFFKLNWKGWKICVFNNGFKKVLSLKYKDGFYWTTLYHNGVIDINYVSKI